MSDSEDRARAAAEQALSESFKVDSSAGLDVPAASRQRSQARPYKVRCPMCETVGYVPRSSAGKEIRCANRDCMVPVFVAPRPEKKTEEEQAPQKKLTPKNLLMGLSCVPLLAFAAWFFLKNQTEGPAPSQSAQQPFRPPIEPPKVDKTTDTPAVVVEKPLTLSEERGPALAFMSKAAQDQNHNRSRPLCERLTAHTAADCGDLKMAESFLERLEHAKNGLTFYRVPPLTSIAWHDLLSKDRAAATKALDEASQAAAELPTVGRFSIDSAAWLGAGLAAAGRNKDAQSLAARFPSSGPSGRLSADAQRAVVWNSYDVDRADQDRLLLDAPSLQLPLIAEICVAMGFPAEGLKLAQSISDPSLQAECEVAWLEAVERAKSLGGNKQPTAGDASGSSSDVLAKLKPAAQARCHARFGLIRLGNKDQAAAESELKAAQQALGSAKAGAEFVLPSVKNIYQLQLPDPGPARQDALAFAEIARLQARLGHVEEADRSLATALDCLRATAPSPIAVDAKQKADKKDRGGLRSELQAALKVSEAQSDAAALQYSRNLKTLGEAADARFARELDILDASLTWADPAKVWKLIGPRAIAGNPNRKEPYFITPLPWQLMIRLKSRGGESAEATIDAIQKVLGESPRNQAAMLDALIAEMNDTKPEVLAKDLKSIEIDEHSDRDRTALIVCDRLVSNGQFPKAFQFARLIEDPILKEEAMQWTAAFACRNGEGHKVKGLLLESNSSFLPTEMVAAWRGFLVGLLARERAEPAAASAAPPAIQPSAAQKPPGEDSKRADASKG
jgi:hypothetical protein